MSKGGVRMDEAGYVKCPMCELKFLAKKFWTDAAKQITKCPFCDEFMKINNPQTMKPQSPTIFYLVTYGHFVNGDSLANATWVERDEAFGGYVWKNYVGGKCPCSDNDKVHEVTMADNIFQLDWTRTYMYAGLDEDFYSGWLSPEGEFVQSARNMYENTADFIIGKDPDELKKEGWLRLEKYDKIPYYTPRKLVTKKQYDWLKEHGYQTVDMEDME